MFLSVADTPRKPTLTTVDTERPVSFLQGGAEGRRRSDTDRKGQGDEGGSDTPSSRNPCKSTVSTLGRGVRTRSVRIPREQP